MRPDMKKSLFAFLPLVLLAGCAGTSAQQNVGLSKWTIDFKDGQPEHVEIIDGKEKANVEFKVDMKKGTASYKATDVSSAEVVALRADVEKELTQAYGEVAPGIVDSIVDLIVTLRAN